MVNIMRYLGQGVIAAAILAFIGYFSTSPAYTDLPAGQALIKLSFSHAANRKEECHTRTAAELAKLPPNMRAPAVCPRERFPVIVELEVDGQRLYHEVLPPKGLAHDGASVIYERVPVVAGSHHLVARLNDDGAAGYNHVREEQITLKPAQVMVIDFKPDAKGFSFQ